MALYHEEFAAHGHQVILRNAEADDAQSMIDLVNALDNETTFLAREPGEFTIPLDKEQELLSQWKESDTTLFIVAQVDGAIVGSCQASCPGRKRYCHKATVAIALREAYCGLGIGRRMLQTLINWAKEARLSHLDLTVDCVNTRAVKLYTSLGFQVSGRLYRDKKMADGSYRDSYVMYLPLE